jgi:hypothetical protein
LSVDFSVTKGFKRLSLAPGGVAERLNAPVLKTGKGETPSWVQIPPPPPAIFITYCFGLLSQKVILWVLNLNEVECYGE